MREALRWAGRIGLWLVILASCAIVLVAVVIPRATGAVPYTILTGSMRPAMPPGTLVVVRPTAPESIKVGDVITFQLSSGRPTVATHRVVAKGIGGRNEVRFLTKGDANDIPDQSWVRPVQLRGKVSYTVAYLGYPAQILTGRHRQLLVYLAAAGLIGYAAVMFSSAVRDRVRKPSGRPERMSM